MESRMELKKYVAWEQLSIHFSITAICSFIWIIIAYVQNLSTTLIVLPIGLAIAFLGLGITTRQRIDFAEKPIGYNKNVHSTQNKIAVYIISLMLLCGMLWLPIWLLSVPNNDDCSEDNSDEYCDLINRLEESPVIIAICLIIIYAIHMCFIYLNPNGE